MAPKKRSSTGPPAAAPRKRTQSGATIPLDDDQSGLERVMDALSLHDFEAGGVRVTHCVPGRPGPHVAATDVIKATTQTTQQNASQQWIKLKAEHPESTSGSCTFRFQGQGAYHRELPELLMAFALSCSQASGVLPPKSWTWRRRCESVAIFEPTT